MSASRTVLYLAALCAFWFPMAASAEGFGLSLNRMQRAGECGVTALICGGSQPDTALQSSNFSLVSQTRVWSALGVFAKFGTTYAGSDAGLSFGGGMSYAFTPRLSASLEWDSNDYRFAAMNRDPVRSTSLGLQYRY